MTQKSCLYRRSRVCLCHRHTQARDDVPHKNHSAPATRERLSQTAVGNRSQRGVCKQGWGRGRAVHRSRVREFMFFKIKAHMEDALQGMSWSKLSPGHGRVVEGGSSLESSPD